MPKRPRCRARPTASHYVVLENCRATRIASPTRALLQCALQWARKTIPKDFLRALDDWFRAYGARRGFGSAIHLPCQAHGFAFCWKYCTGAFLVPAFRALAQDQPGQDLVSSSAAVHLAQHSAAHCSILLRWQLRRFAALHQNRPPASPAHQISIPRSTFIFHSSFLFRLPHSASRPDCAIYAPRSSSTASKLLHARPARLSTNT